MALVVVVSPDVTPQRGIRDVEVEHGKCVCIALVQELLNTVLDLIAILDALRLEACQKGPFSSRMQFRLEEHGV